MVRVAPVALVLFAWLSACASDPAKGKGFACDPGGANTCGAGWVCAAVSGQAYPGVCTPDGLVDVRLDPGPDDPGAEEDLPDAGDAGDEDSPGLADPGADAPCRPADHKACDGGLLFWYDSCGVRGTAAENCPCGCTAAACDCCPDWSCTDWSPCSCGGTQARTCADANACGTSAPKPAETQGCDACGNGLCDCGEDHGTCPADCPGPKCGGVTCPDVAGWTVGCNGKLACEYFGDHGSKMIYVPAGTFQMGCNPVVDADCFDDEFPGHQVALNGYWIDRNEATQLHFKACRDSTDANKCTADPTYGYDPAGHGVYPVVYLNWAQAKQYCGWKCPTCRLCTEAEWERAARGTDGRKYPWAAGGTDCPASWGDQCAGAEWTDLTALANCGESSCHDGFTGATSVGSFPNGASPVGAVDMAGNVWEWVADWYGSDYYCQGPGANTTGNPSWTYCGASAPYASPWANPTGPASGVKRVWRSAGYTYLSASLRTSSRGADSPTFVGVSLGVRCCRSE